MPGGDAQKHDRGPVGGSSSLLPVAERVQVAADRSREAFLSEPEEVSKRHDVGTGFELPGDESAPNTGRHHAFKLGSRELGSVGPGWPSS